MRRDRTGEAVDQPDVLSRKYTKSLSVRLTNDEKLALGGELARAQEEMAELEGQKSEVNAQFKAKIEEKSSRIGTISRLINNGYEYRPVECIEEQFFDENKVTVTRTDTGEIVESRAMTFEERQRPLPLKAVAEKEVES